jgi:hypothetical protein
VADHSQEDISGQILRHLIMIDAGTHVPENASLIPVIKLAYRADVTVLGAFCEVCVTQGLHGLSLSS